MNLKDILNTRDVTIKNILLGDPDIPEEVRHRIEKPLDRAFAQGSLVWAEDHLPTLLGEEEAEQILARLREQV